MLGDEGDVVPDHWLGGGPSAPVDAVLLLYAVDSEALDAAYEAHARRFRDHGLVEVRKLDTADIRGAEPFSPRRKGFPSRSSRGSPGRATSGTR